MTHGRTEPLVHQSIHLEVRMGLSVTNAEILSDVLLRCPQDVQDALLDQLWLRTILVIQRRRTNLAERDEFDARADRILAQLDPQEVSDGIAA